MWAQRNNHNTVQQWPEWTCVQKTEEPNERSPLCVWGNPGRVCKGQSSGRSSPWAERLCYIAAERLCSTSRLPGFTSQMCPLQSDCGQVTYLLCSLPELPQILQYPRICIQPAREWFSRNEAWGQGGVSALPMWTNACILQPPPKCSRLFLGFRPHQGQIHLLITRCIVFSSKQQCP